MNLKGLTQPLTEKIGSLEALIKGMVDNMESLVEFNQKQLAQLEKINENLIKFIEENKTK